MAIRDDLNAAIKTAMRDKNRDELKTLRMLSAAFKQIEVDQRVVVDDEIATRECVRQVKQRQDAARQYHEAGREDLATIEEGEIAIIQRFLPEAMSEAEMHAAVDKALADSGLAQAMSSMGPLMATLKPQLEGRADMAQVSQYLRGKLQG